MLKDKVNKYFRKFGFEVHGVGYMQKLKNTSTQKNEWYKQQELLKGEAQTIFDVGANVGNTTLKYLDLFPNARVHSFEPFPDSYKILIEKLSGKKNVFPNKYALSSKTGTATMNVNNLVDTNSLLESKKIGASSDKSCETQGQVEVETNTLDNYCSQNKIEKIDILKIDVQGFEIEVLKGGTTLLQNNDIRMVYLESYFEQQYINQPLFHDIASMLYKYNFVLQDIYDPYFSISNMLWCDSLFINKTYFN